MTTPNTRSERESRQIAGALVILVGFVVAIGFAIWARQHDDTGHTVAAIAGRLEAWEIREAGRQLLGWLAAGLGVLIALVGVVVVITAPRPAVAR